MSWFGRGELERRVDSLERRVDTGSGAIDSREARGSAPRLWSDRFGALATRSLQLLSLIHI